MTTSIGSDVFLPTFEKGQLIISLNHLFQSRRSTCFTQNISSLVLPISKPTLHPILQWVEILSEISKKKSKKIPRKFLYNISLKISLENFLMISLKSSKKKFLKNFLKIYPCVSHKKSILNSYQLQVIPKSA